MYETSTDIYYLAQMGVGEGPANMERWPNIGFLLAHHLRRWPNSKSTLGQRLMCAAGDGGIGHGG